MASASSMARIFGELFVAAFTAADDIDDFARPDRADGEDRRDAFVGDRVADFRHRQEHPLNAVGWML